MTTSFLTIKYNSSDCNFEQKQNKCYEMAKTLVNRGIVFELWNMEYGKYNQPHIHAKVKSPFNFQYKPFNKDGYHVHGKKYIQEFHLDYMMKESILPICTNITHYHTDLNYQIVNDFYDHNNPILNECLIYNLQTINTHQDLIRTLIER